MDKTAVLFLTTGFEEAEALVTLDMLRRGGVAVTTASLTGDLYVTGSHDITVRADALFEDVKDAAYDALILPGGPGTSRYFEHENLLNRIKKAAECGHAVIAAICAAPSVLGYLGLLNGKRATCFPGFEDKLTGATVTGQPSETDGRVVTGKSAGCVFDFSFALLKYLCGDETAEKIRSAVYYKN